MDENKDATMMWNYIPYRYNANLFKSVPSFIKYILFEYQRTYPDNFSRATWIAAVRLVHRFCASSEPRLVLNNQNAYLLFVVAFIIVEKFYCGGRLILSVENLQEAVGMGIGELQQLESEFIEQMNGEVRDTDIEAMVETLRDYDVVGNVFMYESTNSISVRYDPEHVLHVTPKQILQLLDSDMVWVDEYENWDRPFHMPGIETHFQESHDPLDPFGDIYEGDSSPYLASAAYRFNEAPKSASNNQKSIDHVGDVENDSVASLLSVDWHDNSSDIDNSSIVSEYLAEDVNEPLVPIKESENVSASGFQAYWDEFYTPTKNTREKRTLSSSCPLPTSMSDARANASLPCPLGLDSALLDSATLGPALGPAPLTSPLCNPKAGDSFDVIDSIAPIRKKSKIAKSVVPDESFYEAHHRGNRGGEPCGDRAPVCAPIRRSMRVARRLFHNDVPEARYDRWESGHDVGIFEFSPSNESSSNEWGERNNGYDDGVRECETSLNQMPFEFKERGTAYRVRDDRSAAERLFSQSCHSRPLAFFYRF